MEHLADFQRPYARPYNEVAAWKNSNRITLLDVIHQVKPTILIGCSTVHGAFDETVVQAMASYCPRPIIFPLSNPTSKAEATPSDLLQWTAGKAIIATGSPFDDVTYQGNTYRISQSNNAFIFPGIGLGVISARATRLSDNMI